MNLDDLKLDLSSFADEEHDVDVDDDGSILLMCRGEEISAQLYENGDGVLMVRIDGTEITYRSFITRRLARLDVLAERLVSRREPVGNFIDSTVTLDRPAETRQTLSAIEALHAECENSPPFAARVSFITADAGHGKTILLREMQSRQATSFLAGTSQYLFWHVDLQGRQLLRLSEALMGDLGDLRFSGLWMPGIIRLIRSRALVLAIDGFDELSAEQGGSDALGALATLVNQLDGKGVVIAAARRTFFDTEDYLRRANLLGRALEAGCQFDQISLRPWDRKEGIKYITSLRDQASGPILSLGSPEQIYEDISIALGNDGDHPIITRPFLLAQVCRAVLHYGVPVQEFMRTEGDPLLGVAKVIEAFVKREVQEKWVYSDTGEPYLTAKQHMQLLAEIAEEMYRSQKDRLTIEVVETIAAALLDEWSVDPSRRAQVLDMVKMHVLLVRPPDGGDRFRAFDHPEFRDYFIACALRGHLLKAMNDGSHRDLSRYLSIAQITDSTARYVFGMLDRTEDAVNRLLRAFEAAIEQDWRPTFLQTNVGTLIPFALTGLLPTRRFVFSGRAIVSSLAFENTQISHAELTSLLFVNASLAGASWFDVTLRNCELGELYIDGHTTFEAVLFEDCHVDGIRVGEGPDNDEVREYAPARIASVLDRKGVTIGSAVNASQLELVSIAADSEFENIVRKVLLLFARTTVVSERMLLAKFRFDRSLVQDRVIPLLIRYQIVKPRTWKGSGNDRIWALTKRLDVVLDDESANDGEVVEFWKEIRA